MGNLDFVVSSSCRGLLFIAMWAFLLFEDFEFMAGFLEPLAQRHCWSQRVHQLPKTLNIYGEFSLCLLSPVLVKLWLN